VAQGCIFCETSPTTDAHVFRKGWFKTLAPDINRFRHVHTRSEGPDPFEVEWRKTSADFKVNCACQSCNGGWMHRLDLAGEELFATAAALGRPAGVESPVDRHTLARWCLLIAVLFDQAQRPPRLGQTVHRALYRGDLPPDVGVWLAATESPEADEPLASAHAKDWGQELKKPGKETEVSSSSLPHTAEGYFLTFRVLQLLAQVFVPLEDTGHGVAARRIGNAAAIRQLWPDTLKPLVWPPHESIPREEIDAFTRFLRYWEPR
jgi:hypothetical protein